MALLDEGKYIYDCNFDGSVFTGCKLQLFDVVQSRCGQQRMSTEDVRFDNLARRIDCGVYLNLSGYSGLPRQRRVINRREFDQPQARIRIKSMGGAKKF